MPVPEPGHRLFALLKLFQAEISFAQEQMAPNRPLIIHLVLRRLLKSPVRLAEQIDRSLLVAKLEPRVSFAQARVQSAGGTGKVAQHLSKSRRGPGVIAFPEQRLRDPVPVLVGQFARIDQPRAQQRQRIVEFLQLIAALGLEEDGFRNLVRSRMVFNEIGELLFRQFIRTAIKNVSRHIVSAALRAASSVKANG